MATALKKSTGFVSVTGAANILGVTPGRIRQLVGSYEKNALPAQKLGQKEWIISLADLRKYAKKAGVSANFSGCE